MQIHELKRKNKNKSRKIVGRGGKRGKTSGRGTKGQNARAGRKKRPELRDIIKKLPKLRGYKFKSIVAKPVVINIELLNSHFDNGAVVTREVLLEKKLISNKSGALPKVKILGAGELSKSLTLKGFTVSKSAREKIEKGGGTIS